MTLNDSIADIKRLLYHQGKVVETKRWQGKEDHPAFLEVLQPVIKVQMVDEPTCGDQPWAAEHFAERVSGKPLNPPPSHTKWRMKTSDYMIDGKFDHTYPERMWPKGLMTGIRFDVGDLGDIVKLLKKDITTRQAVMPMFSYEDITAGIQGRRVPCSLSWNFIVRDNKMHCTYSMRSCDAVRHLHNDIYFANMLVIWILSQLEQNIGLGTLQINIMSLHCFVSDRPLLGVK